MAKAKSFKLTILRAKDHTAQDADLVREIAKFDKGEVNTGSLTKSKLFVHQLNESLPKWARYFETSGDPLIRALRNKSSGAILIVRSATGTYALSFGQAHHYLKLDAFEERFGLLVTLNSVRPNQMRKVDTVSLGSKGRQASIQVGNLGMIGDFGLNIDSDLIRKVAAAPADKALGALLVGRQSLVLNVHDLLPDLEQLLTKLDERFRDQSYKTQYEFLDHVGQVENRDLIAKLDDLMLSKFKDTPGSEGRLWAAVPEVVEWERIAFFAYRENDKAQRFNDVKVQEMRETFSRTEPASLSVDHLKSRYVYAFPEEGGYSTYHWSMYRCLYSEISHDGSLYILTNGLWFRVASDFVSEIEAELQALDSVPDGFSLPEFNDENEAAYNKRAESITGYYCMDTKNIMYGGGSSRIELCDLISKDGYLVYVKRYGGSSPLSHLFQQGAVAANTIAMDPRFRKEVNEKLPDGYKLMENEDGLQTERYTVVFAITTRKDKPITQAIPFFSKVSLRNTARLLKAMRYKVVAVGIKDTRVQPEADAEE